MSRSKKSRVRLATTAALAVAGVLCAWPVAGAQAATVAVNCAKPGSSLQNTIDAVPAKSTILVSGTCAGTFHVQNKSLTLRGNPWATLDAEYNGTALTVDAPDNTVRLERLTVTHGMSISGGGISHNGGHLILNRVRVSKNEAFAATPLTIASGGGIRNYAGALTLTRSTVFGNKARSLAGHAAFGGGIHVDSGNLVVSSSSVSGNLAYASAASSYARAWGGGIYAGGAVVTLRRSTVNGNRADAVAASDDAYSLGGGVFAEDKVVASASTVSRNTVGATTSAPLPASGQSYGGGLNAPVVRATNTTIALNKVRATAPAGSGMAHAGGGGIGGAETGLLASSTVAKNSVVVSGGNPSALGGGLATDTGLTLRATILAGNVAAGAADCIGDPKSAGYNLIRNPSGCGFAAKGSDRLGKAAGLGSLRNNGGPTQTMAISASSAARNAIGASACTVRRDERGVRRPQGGRCDIGAYERRVK